ncbi:MAG: hypothetical protein II814_13605, partial [Treponema sp.]|nr:hypothetical protein [Treponema sp.]
RQKVKYKKNGSGDYSRQSELVRRFHNSSIQLFLSIINTKNTDKKGGTQKKKLGGPRQRAAWPQA